MNEEIGVSGIDVYHLSNERQAMRGFCSGYFSFEGEKEQLSPEPISKGSQNLGMATLMFSEFNLGSMVVKQHTVMSYNVMQFLPIVVQS